MNDSNSVSPDEIERRRRFESSSALLPSAPAPSVEPHEIDCLTHAGVDECRCAEKRQWRVEQADDRAAQDRAAVVTWLETRVADTEAEVNALDAWLANTGNAFGREWESKEAMRDAVACRLEWLRAELAALHADPPKEPR